MKPADFSLPAACRLPTGSKSQRVYADQVDGCYCIDAGLGGDGHESCGSPRGVVDGQIEALRVITICNRNRMRDVYFARNSAAQRDSDLRLSY